MREPRYYGPTFRQEAVALIGPTRSMAQVARDLGVPISNLSRWYKAQMGKRMQPKPGENAAPTASASETPEQKIVRLERENAALRKKNAELETDRAILKKAAAFFAKESE